MLSVGSLFSGIGGFDLGLERAGMRTAWFCESDPFCRRVLAKHWPDVPCFSDVTELRQPPPVDVLCGGFPCQDLSYAGKGAGIDGARSGLWSEYARLIREIRPRYVIVENVSALLTRGIGRVLGDMASIGYDAEWDCIPASAIGAPHRRNRIWIVGYPHDESEPALTVDDEAPRLSSMVADAEVVAIRPGLREGEPRGQRRGRSGDSSSARDAADPDREQHEGRSHEEWRPTTAQLSADATGNGRRQGRSRGSTPSGEGQSEQPLQDADERALQPWRVGGRVAQAGGSEWWAVEPPVGRVAHGVPDRLDQLASLGNALVPQIAEWIGRRIVSYEEGQLAA